MGLSQTPNNLARLLLDRAARHPDHRFWVVPAADNGGDPAAGSGPKLVETVDVASCLAATLGSVGVAPGARVAMIGRTCQDYLQMWAALQLAGAEVALINPAYPAELLSEMLRPLAPAAVVWVRRQVEREVAPSALHLVADDCAVGLRIGADRIPLAPAGDLPGLARRPLDIAGWMHTSGTTGTPKFCTQTHEYFLRLGRYVADSLALGEADTVFAPLPLFHINPLGYGVIGSLVGHSQVMGWERFSAGRFWPLAQQAGATVCIMHAPPIEMLKRAYGSATNLDHRVRAVLFADAEFLERFDVPLGLSVYGSTEAGGLTHAWMWRRGEAVDAPEGISRYGGDPRADVDWLLADDGEILVRGREPGVLFSGYLRSDGIDPAVDSQGWFHTGDLGRLDERGGLVFLERAVEAIKVKGEYVPIGYVEEQLRTVRGLDDLALWRRDSDLVDHEAVLYVSAAAIPAAELIDAASVLPAFMRPTAVVRVAGPLPRDAGVGKVIRRSLDNLTVIEELRLDYSGR
jgi:acyl-CoA synthetase (AMP-forming)/AMP-acid ligase II